MNAEDFLTMLSPLMERSMVHEAVIRGLIAAHPDPAALRRQVDSLLMQAQGTLALTEQPLPSLRAVGPIVDSLFQPPIVLPPGPE